MAIQESGEMYLEAIYVLSRQKPSVRSVDIGEYMGYSKPSVSRAIRLLKAEGLIEVDDNGFITFTERGRDTAYWIYERHTVLTDFLIRLGVDPDIAAKDACKIEHHLSEESFLAIRRFTKNQP